MRPRIPDILCFSRVALGLFLLFLVPLSNEFLILFGICCLTDVLDGFMARRCGETVPYGYALDSTCDAILAIILLICIIPVINWQDWMIYWVAAIAAVRTISFGIGSGRFGRPAFVHTVLNKFTGLLLFLSPFLLRLLDDGWVIIIICAIASVSAAEYLYLNCTSRTFDSDLRTAFAGTRKQ